MRNQNQAIEKKKKIDLNRHISVILTVKEKIELLIVWQLLIVVKVRLETKF